MQEIQIQSLGQEDPPTERNGNPLQHSCLGNLMDREAWWATVHRLTKDLDTQQLKTNNSKGSRMGALQIWELPSQG